MSAIYTDLIGLFFALDYCVGLQALFIQGNFINVTLFFLKALIHTQPVTFFDRGKSELGPGKNSRLQVESRLPLFHM